ncbi:MAG: PQQ-dependent sugar dehydrogenase [Actinomycetota bacterium]
MHHRSRPLRALLAIASVAVPAIPTAASAQEARVDPIVADAAFPTNLARTDDGTLLYTEKETGRVRVVDPDGSLRDAPLIEVPVTGGAERGLLGIALDPDEEWVYLYLSDAGERNRVVRFPREGGEPEAVFEGLPSVSGYHNGGDLAFGPDGMLYVITGEAHDPDLAQDPGSVGGKILRLTPTGEIPADNPDPGSPVFALGIRNSFGICVDPRTGEIWETENGPDRDDEINRVPPAGNLGWPLHLGRGGAPRFVDPVLVYPDVIVPTGCTVTDDGSVYFGDFAGAIHRVTPRNAGADDTIIARVPEGITDVTDDDGALLVATSGGIYRVSLNLEPEADAPVTPTEPADTPAPQDRSPDTEEATWVWIAGGAVVAIATLAVVIARRRAGRRPS